jgi:hypothetical protein
MGNVCARARVCVCLSLSLSLCVCLPVCVCLSVCLSVFGHIYATFFRKFKCKKLRGRLGSTQNNDITIDLKDFGCENVDKIYLIQNIEQ